VTLSREINRLLISILGAFTLIALAASYWAVVGPDTILLRDDNPRRVVAEAAIRRGDIVDRGGELLATSVVEANNRIVRRYPHPEASSLLGYSSLRYGVSGAEAAYNATLRGDDLPIETVSKILSDILHRPQVGSSIQITLDHRVQQAIMENMGDQVGAAVILSATDGAVLGLLSLPTYDPNSLDSDWDALVAAPQKPFFNRALQGQYQPGGTLQTLLMAAALVSSQSLTDLTSNATMPVQADNVAISCALRLPTMELSLRDAYAFACPLPFENLAIQLGVQPIVNTFELVRIYDPPVLQGFVAPAPQPLPTPLQPETLVKNALGQGDITVTPLQMAVLAAAIINDGNAPQPYVLLATHAPNDTSWTQASAAHSTQPYMTERTARQLQDLMRNTVANGASLNAARPGIDIGGHSALAYSGTETQAWFIGFASLPGRRGIATAVVLENSDDPGLAADIGGAILSAAHQILSQTSP
jgi:peptidoglycan glycosyltransferase